MPPVTSHEPRPFADKFDLWSWLGAAHLAETGLVPFAAVAARRQRLAWAEIGWWRLALTLAVYLALLFGHARVIGVDPLASAFGPWVMFP